MKRSEDLSAVAEKVEAALRRQNVQLTLGGEPTYVPIEPEGSEWSITALGPTKLGYAYAMADALVAQALPHALTIYTPGKSYPGEVNPRWALQLVWNKDGSPLTRSLTRALPRAGAIGKPALEQFKETLLDRLRLSKGWVRGVDAADPRRAVWVLPLDTEGSGFRSEDWKLGTRLQLLGAQGPAGLRLPLGMVPPEVSRRALVIEQRDDRLHLFLPPFLQAPLLKLLDHVISALRSAKLPQPLFEGYLPGDEAERWSKLGLTPDPGVLEINLPPCATWAEYDTWLRNLERAAEAAGLRSFKQISPEESGGTGGGNHLLFGGPSLEDHPFFTNPRWVTSILRYWQRHPSLSYLFTGVYVGPSSQAPRPDESASALYDLEMAYRFLEQLPAGDHRGLISETLRHLHTDGSGNTHRSEVSFDKFWNVAFDGGCRGLMEFRALESLPRAEWMSAVALLWRAAAAALLARPCTDPLIDHAEQLHDYYYLPSNLWADFEQVLRDLRRAGFALPSEPFRAILDWRFPVMLAYRRSGALLTMRKAHEGWPLLCETPLEGGTTSRFVDTSIERLEFVANARFLEACEVHIEGRRLPLDEGGAKSSCLGLRYRRTALYPSLHPGMAPQMPLHLTITHAGVRTAYRLEFGRRSFVELPVPEEAPAPTTQPCKRLHPRLVTCDLRLP